MSRARYYGKEPAMTRRSVLWLSAMAVMLGGPAVAAPVRSPSGIDRNLSLEWEVGQSRRRGTVVSGFVLNSADWVAADVQVLVETLDAAGQPVASAVGFVFGVIQPRGRSSFEVPVRVEGPSYRVTVTSFNWRAGGGAG